VAPKKATDELGGGRREQQIVALYTGLAKVPAGLSESDQFAHGPIRTMNRGGDKRTPIAKIDVARREQQIVALYLRGIPTHQIAGAVGVTRRAVQIAFKKAIHRQTEDALDGWHRIELAKLAQEEANVWRVMDLPENKNNAKVQLAGEDRLLRIHIRRAKLLGLDAPTKLDLGAFYGKGTESISAERMAREAVLEALPLDEQRRVYEIFYQAGLRAQAGDLSQPAIETTVSNGTEHRDGE
jgi:hypothetical protein